jgi:hypothetical protein
MSEPRTDRPTSADHPSDATVGRKDAGSGEHPSSNDADVSSTRRRFSSADPVAAARGGSGPIRLRRAAAFVALGLIAAAAILIAGAWGLTNSPPTWWRDLPPVDPQGTRIAEELENAVVNHLHAARPPDASGFAPDGSWQSEAWSVSLQAADANFWLNSRLARWLSNREPSIDWNAVLVQTLAEFHDGRIWIGSKIRAGGTAAGGGSARVVAAVLRPEVRADGTLWLTAEDFTVGRLSVPPGWVLPVGGDSARSMLSHVAGVPGVTGNLRDSDSVADIAGALAGSHPLAQEPALRLADGRRVRLLAVSITDDRLDLTCRTEGVRK